MESKSFVHQLTKLTAILSLLIVGLIGVGITLSLMGNSPMVFHCGSIELSSGELDGQITLAIIGAWLGLLSVGIIARDRRRK